MTPTKRKVKPKKDIPVLLQNYNILRSEGMLKNLAEISYAASLIDLCLFSLALLKADCEKIDLISMVVGKKYHAYRKIVVTASHAFTTQPDLTGRTVQAPV